MQRSMVEADKPKSLWFFSTSRIVKLIFGLAVLEKGASQHGTERKAWKCLHPVHHNPSAMFENLANLCHDFASSRVNNGAEACVLASNFRQEAF